MDAGAGPTAGWFIRDLTRIDPLHVLDRAALIAFAGVMVSVLPFRSDDDRMILFFGGWRRWPPGFWWLKNHRGHSHRPIDRGLIGYRLHVLWGAGVGRMDMMCVLGDEWNRGLSLAAARINLLLAILASQAGVAAAGLNTPLALGACAGLIALTLYYDWRAFASRTWLWRFPI